jgi:hypothetical protein
MVNLRLGKGCFAPRSAIVSPNHCKGGVWLIMIDTGLIYMRLLICIISSTALFVLRITLRPPEFENDTLFSTLI